MKEILHPPKPILDQAETRLSQIRREYESGFMSDRTAIYALFDAMSDLLWVVKELRRNA